MNCHGTSYNIPNNSNTVGDVYDIKAHISNGQRGLSLKVETVVSYSRLRTSTHYTNDARQRR